MTLKPGVINRGSKSLLVVNLCICMLNKKKYSSASLMIAAEAITLPTDDIRKHIYGLLKSINHAAEQNNKS